MQNQVSQYNTIQYNTIQLQKQLKITKKTNKNNQHIKTIIEIYSMSYSVTEDRLRC